MAFDKKAYNKMYQKSYMGLLNTRRKNWRTRGLNMSNFDRIYERYLNAERCELCNKEFVMLQCGYSNKCMEHNHDTGEFRSICCRSCNNRMAFIDKRNREMNEF